MGGLVALRPDLALQNRDLRIAWVRSAYLITLVTEGNRLRRKIRNEVFPETGRDVMFRCYGDRVSENFLAFGAGGWKR